MKIMKALLVGSVLFTASQLVSADTVDALESSRVEVMKQYLTSLADANVAGMNSIFTQESTVVSTSAGEKNALTFFANFFPYILEAHTEMHQLFMSIEDENRYGARFHLDYRLNDGDVGSGEYVDEFVFYKGSNKLKSVYMFENLRFPQSVAR